MTIAPSVANNADYANLPGLNAERCSDILQITQHLIQQHTLSGNEQAAVKVGMEWMKRLGYDEVNIDECGNLIGILRAGTGPTMVFDSHLDTVAADPSAWKTPPFSGKVVDGKIYGRGGNDMKGAFAASMAAMAYAKADGKLQGTVYVLGSVGEEDIEGLGISRLIPRINPNLVIICEPSGLKLITAQRGRAEISINVIGKSAHASKPYLGVNALRQASRLVAALDELQPPVDPLLGPGILEPTEIISAPFPNVSVVPWNCRIKYDRRVLVGETIESILVPVQAVIDRLSAADPTFKAQAIIEQGEFTCYSGLKLVQERFAPAWRLSPDSPWIGITQGALKAAGLPAETGYYSFCTNGSLTSGRLGIPTLGYGPGFEEIAHIDDEYLELGQLFGAAAGYYALGTCTKVV